MPVTNARFIVSSPEPPDYYSEHPIGSVQRCRNQGFSSCLFAFLRQVLLLLRGYMLKNRLHLLHVTRPGVLLHRLRCGFTEAATQVRVAAESLDNVCELVCISRLLQDKAVYAV